MKERDLQSIVEAQMGLRWLDLSFCGGLSLFPVRMVEEWAVEVGAHKDESRLTLLHGVVLPDWGASAVTTGSPAA